MPSDNHFVSRKPRVAANDSGVYATPRSVFAGCEDVVNSPLSVEAIADATVFKGLDKDTKLRILAACPLPVISNREAIAA